MAMTITSTDTFPELGSARLDALLARLYGNALRQDPGLRQAASAQGIGEQDPGFYGAMRGAYMPVTPEFGKLLYLLARAVRARSVVEYGTSFGISTLFLAAALRDNGGGRLITTELEPAKVARARAHLEEAGLSDLVELRAGDALRTLREGLPASIDLLLLDGAKSQYLAVLRLLEARLAPCALVAADNSDMEASAAFLAHVRDPAHGYVAAALGSRALGAFHGHEIMLRAA